MEFLLLTRSEVPTANDDDSDWEVASEDDPVRQSPQGQSDDDQGPGGCAGPAGSTRPSGIDGEQGAAGSAGAGSSDGGEASSPSCSQGPQGSCASLSLSGLRASSSTSQAGPSSQRPVSLASGQHPTGIVAPGGSQCCRSICTEQRPRACASRNAQSKSSKASHGCRNPGPSTSWSRHGSDVGSPWGAGARPGPPWAADSPGEASTSPGSSGPRRAHGPPGPLAPRPRVTLRAGLRPRRSYSSSSNSSDGYSTDDEDQQARPSRAYLQRAMGTVRQASRAGPGESVSSLMLAFCVLTLSMGLPNRCRGAEIKATDVVVFLQEQCNQPRLKMDALEALAATHATEQRDLRLKFVPRSGESRSSLAHRSSHHE